MTGDLQRHTLIHMYLSVKLKAFHKPRLSLWVLFSHED